MRTQLKVVNLLRLDRIRSNTISSFCFYKFTLNYNRLKQWIFIFFSVVGELKNCFRLKMLSMKIPCPLSEVKFNIPLVVSMKFFLLVFKTFRTNWEFEEPLRVVIFISHYSIFKFRFYQIIDFIMSWWI